MKTALISVFDKNGIVDFCKGLKDLGYQLISTGGTYQLLKEEVEVKEVSELTGFPEILDGRVKTLHPRIHAGILYRRESALHQKTVEELGIDSIELVVNNLYPFEKILKKEGASEEEQVENIDIGGPSMIRAGAKNFRDVLVVTDPGDYEEVLHRLQEGRNDLTYRESMAAKAFRYTAYYDALISEYFNNRLSVSDPEYLSLSYRLGTSLRYGENPHQNAAFYEKVYEENPAEWKQLHGKELSYNNYTDMYNAVRFVKEFSEPAVVGTKHNNPAGIGIGENIDEAFDKAYACDATSLFGGIFALNRPVTKHIAEVLHSFFMEIVIAPDYEKEALAILEEKKNLRVIEMPNLSSFSLPKKTVKEVLGGILVQDYDDADITEEMEVVSKRKPTEEEMRDLRFGFKAVKMVASNGAVLVKDGATLGIGQGQVRRTWAVEDALSHGEGKHSGAVLASDGFFFADTVELLQKHGIRAAIQPGGSVKDPEVIALCDQYGIALVMTHIRHFRH